MEINIIGMGPGKELAQDQVGEKWGLTNVIFEMPVDVLFDIHQIENYSEDRKHLYFSVRDKCKKTNTPIFTCKNYPLKEMISEFKAAYFSSSICYALAMAISKNPETINLFGIYLTKMNGIEYGEQKPGVDFWVGVAHGRGINVNINGEFSEVRQTPTGFIYGYGLEQKILEAEHVRSK